MITSVVIRFLASESFDTKKAEFYPPHWDQLYWHVSSSLVGFYYLLYSRASHNAPVLCVLILKEAVWIQRCLYNLRWKQILWWHTNPDTVWIYFYVSILWITHAVFLFISYYVALLLPDIVSYFMLPLYVNYPKNAIYTVCRYAPLLFLFLYLDSIHLSTAY